MPYTGIKAARYQNIAGAGTNTVKAGAGVLRRITINSGAAATITVYDSRTGSGKTIATIAASAPVADLEYGVTFDIGLTIVTAGATDITVAYE